MSEGQKDVQEIDIRVTEGFQKDGNMFKRQTSSDERLS